MNRFSSIFSQLLQLFPRLEFYQMVKETKAERHARGFTCWGQFVAMLFCQLGRAHSLREITNGLRSCEGKLKHLGITAPKRSTLAYANEHRPWELYQKVFFALLNQCRAQVVGKKKFRFKNKLVSLDSTTIDLCLSIYDWAHFRRTKGAIKLHLVLDHDGYLPTFAVMTDGKCHDVKVAYLLKFDPGTIVVDDRDTGFVKGGPASTWRYENEGYNNNLTWTTNNYNANSNYNWGRWFPKLAARSYEVFVYIPERFTTTAQARYWINHADGYTLRIVDQSANGSRWVSLGTYRFQGTRDDYVSLADVTFETTTSLLIAFDAVKWEPR